MSPEALLSGGNQHGRWCSQNFRSGICVALSNEGARVLDPCSRSPQSQCWFSRGFRKGNQMLVIANRFEVSTLPECIRKINLEGLLLAKDISAAFGPLHTMQLRSAAEISEPIRETVCKSPFFRERATNAQHQSCKASRSRVPPDR